MPIFQSAFGLLVLAGYSYLAAACDPEACVQATLEFISRSNASRT